MKILMAGVRSDDEIWAALHQVSLKEMVLRMGSSVTISKRRDRTWSRHCAAFVSRTSVAEAAKVIIMDEATASVDIVTDSVVQSTIRSAFAASTIVTIAHRLNTVIDFDRIVAGQGQDKRARWCPELLQLDGSPLPTSESIKPAELRRRAAATFTRATLRLT